MESDNFQWSTLFDNKNRKFLSKTSFSSSSSSFSSSSSSSKKGTRRYEQESDSRFSSKNSSVRNRSRSRSRSPSPSSSSSSSSSSSEKERKKDSSSSSSSSESSSSSSSEKEKEKEKEKKQKKDSLFSSSSASTSTIGNKELIIFSQHAHFAKTKKPIYFSYENQHVCVTNRVAPAAKGSRAEDTTAIYEKDGYGLYGIFDGHGGPKVSDNLAKYFLPWLYQKFQSEKIPSKMDIQQWFVDYNEDLKKLKVKDDGSTALVLIKTPYAFHVAHCGDSRGVVYNMYTSSILHMTRDHDPSDDKQASEFLRADSSRRIEKVNGTYRVDGVLNLLRSFGDFGVNGISAEPEVFTRERNENHKFRSDWIFFGATDGYWNQYRLETKNKNNDRYSRQQAELLTQNVINKIEAYRTSSMSKSNNTSFLASMCQNINDRQAHDDVGTMITYLYDY